VVASHTAWPPTRTVADVALVSILDVADVADVAILDVDDDFDDFDCIGPADLPLTAVGDARADGPLLVVGGAGRVRGDETTRLATVAVFGLEGDTKRPEAGLALKLLLNAPRPTADELCFH
jgi:hypothetical protein